VPKKNLENLHHVLVWLYGSKSDSIKPVIVSQNPDLKMLGAVLSNPGARTVLMMRNNLREAYQQVESKSARFETALVNARQEVETAMSQIIGYDPDDTTLLEIGRELRDNTDLLYDTMESITKKVPAKAAKAKGKK
jgi:hypothetical protein